MTSIDPFTNAEPPRRQFVVGRAIFVLAALGMLALVLLMFASGLLAGGQFGPTATSAWEPLVAWPLVSIPAWLVISLCCAGAVGALVLAPAARWPQAIEFPFFIAVTLLLFTLMPFGFARMYPDAAGTVFDSNFPELGLAWHWVGALPQIVTVIVLVVRLVMLAPAYNRATREQRENLV